MGNLPQISSIHLRLIRFAEEIDMAISTLIEVTDCKPLPDYKLKVKCSDGTSGVFDMSKYMNRGIFRSIASPGTFERVYLSFGVPTWPGDIDIAAERVRSDMTLDA